MEQMKRAKEITQQLDEMEVSYRQSCPYTSSWKSEEALIEIASFKSRLEAIKEEVSEHEVERYLMTFSKLMLLSTTYSNGLKMYIKHLTFIYIVIIFTQSRRRV
jgi:hypothetical protein